LMPPYGQLEIGFILAPVALQSGRRRRSGHCDETSSNAGVSPQLEPIQ
jgi:hypothetical protein